MNLTPDQVRLAHLTADAEAIRTSARRDLHACLLLALDARHAHLSGQSEVVEEFLSRIMEGAVEVYDATGSGSPIDVYSVVLLNGRELAEGIANAAHDALVSLDSDPGFDVADHLAAIIDRCVVSEMTLRPVES